MAHPYPERRAPVRAPLDWAYNRLPLQSFLVPAHARPSIWCVSRAAPPHRRTSHVAVAERSGVRGRARSARLRRVLVRRASFDGLGGDRVTGALPRRGRRAHASHSARHWRRVLAVPPPVHGGAAAGATRSPNPWPPHFRFGARRAAVRRAHAWAWTRWCCAIARTRRWASSGGCSRAVNGSAPRANGSR